MGEQIHRVNVKGGMLSPSELQDIIEYAETLGLDSFHFGSRQDIIFPLINANGVPIEELETYDKAFFSECIHQNISCSYVSIDVFNSTVWLRGTTYLYILEEFNYHPQLKINITDPKQQMVPLFSGDLNFIASDRRDYWYLFLKLPGWEETFYPVLVYTWDIAKIAKEIEFIYQKVSNADELFKYLNEKLDTNNKVIEKPLEIAFNPFPYYEGMNKMNTDQYWLGLYWRNNRYDLTFLKHISGFCVEHRIGKICLTPWKSLIIKGIANKHKLGLEKLLGSFGINVRHSALELNWHLPVADQRALDLKKFLVMNFDQNDISTYGLTFAITANINQKEYFTSIVIEENKVLGDSINSKSRPVYNVIHARNFDPNTRDYMVYAQDVDKTDLPDLLLELTKTYFINLGEENTLDVANSKPALEIVAIKVYQCKDCKTIYDPTIGDPVRGIGRGVDFENLPEDYQCSLCDANKGNFQEISLEITE